MYQIWIFLYHWHGVDEGLQKKLEDESQHFLLGIEAKMDDTDGFGRQSLAGLFPVGGELTSGKPDLKEGLYFGTELGTEDPRVLAGTPLHGANLFPGHRPAFKAVVLEYMAALTDLGHQLMRGCR